MKNINIINHINYKFLTNDFTKACRNPVAFPSDKEQFTAEEIKLIDDCFTIMNSSEFYFGEYFGAIFIRHIEISSLHEIALELYKNEKKRNPYLKLDDFKEITFENLQYQIQQILNPKHIIKEFIRNSFYYCESMGHIKSSKNTAIFTDLFFNDKDILIDYLNAVIEFTYQFNPDENLTVAEINQTPDSVIPEEEILTKTQVDKIGLFVRSGIIQFLRDKNPGIKDSDLSRFIRELTSEPLKNSESIRPHLTQETSSNKHPFYKKGKIEDYDMILKKYKISPQTEK